MLDWTCHQEKEQHMPEVSAGSSLRPSAVGAESNGTTALRAGVRAVILEAGDDAGSLTYRKADIKAAMQDEWSLVTADQSAAETFLWTGWTRCSRRRTMEARRRTG